jgi:hypothetical protein
MLALTSKEFQSKITVSYRDSLASVYIEAGKACLEQAKSLTYLQIHLDTTKMPGLPSWRVNLEPPSTEILPFDVHLCTGIRYDDPEAEATIQTFSDRHSMELVGFRAGSVDRIVPPFEKPSTGPPIEIGNRRKKWLAHCLQVTISTLNSDPTDSEVFLAHSHVVTANTTVRVPDSNSLKQACADVELNTYSQTPGYAGRLPYDRPQVRILPFNDTRTYLFRACSGRAYFIPSGGRLGIGPAMMEPGDLVIVIYGARPVFVVREILGSSNFQFVGDAFVHGLMELSKTPTDTICNETFCIA